jgi:hypothetical protein
VNVLLLSAARLFATRFLAASEISDYQLATATVRDPTLTGTVRGRDTKAECGCRGGRIAAFGLCDGLANVGWLSNLCRAETHTSTVLYGQGAHARADRGTLPTGEPATPE